MEDNTGNASDSRSRYARRDFIATALKTSAVLVLPGIDINVRGESLSKSYTVQDVIDIILKDVPGAPFPKTVDTLKSGSADQRVTGIVSTMFPTAAVIEEAIRFNANFIIAHEPTYYNHTDDPNWVQNNSVQKKKQDLLQQHGIAIWRFHDGWHSHHPDGIRYGVLKATGWLQYDTEAKPVLKIPPVRFDRLVEQLKSALHIDHVRVIGKPEKMCESIVIIPGAAGGQVQIAFAEKEKPDVLIVGEVHEWETAEYIRDAQHFGSNTSLIVLGHAASEEPGMEWLAEWLQPKIPELKITHIPSGSPFQWL